MSFQQYQAFLTAAKHHSFKKASEELGYTQAGISYMISALEKELGFTLFNRAHSGVKLTPDGLSLLPWIQDVYKSEKALQDHIAEMRDLETGSLRIACFASTAIQWLPGIMKEFLTAHPRIDISFTVYENQAPMEQDTWHGDFDCCFVILPTALPFFTIPLVQDPMYAVVSKNHPLAHEPFFPTNALAHEPYIKIRNDSFTEMDEVFQRHGVTPNTRFVVDNDYAVLGMIQNGLGFGLFPQLLLRGTTAEVIALPPEIPTHREVGIAVRSYSKSSFATKAFIECVRSWISENEPKQLHQ